jgi:DNA-binding transcriptional ArsR family regulator
VTTGTLVPVFAALGDETRWSILAALGEGDASASALAGRLPVTRQAIAKHLAALEEAGLAEATRVGRETRYALRTDPFAEAEAWMRAIGATWDRRLASFRGYAESVSSGTEGRRNR